MQKYILMLLGAIYGGISALYTPVCLSIAFNLTKGVGNNPEGVIFIPLGIIMLLAFLAIDTLIIVKIAKSENMSALQKTITILVFFIIKAACFLMIDQNGLRNFLKDFNIKYLHRGLI